MGVNRILINPFLSREMHSSSKKWLMRIRLTISQMEECIFLDKKGLMRIRLTISQMEEFIFLDKKGLTQLPTLMTPPRMEECVGVGGTRPRGRCMLHRCKGNRMLM